jgi:hypothetical protein
MAFELGIFTEYGDPNTEADPLVLSLASAIQLPRGLGQFWNDCGLFQAAEANRKFEIYNRTETQRNGTIGGAGWVDAIDTTALPVTSADGLIIGQVLKVEDEVVVISAVDTSADTIDVFARGAGGSTAAAHVATTAYSIIGSAINDTDLKDIDSVSEITGVYENYFQTVAEPIDFTKFGIALARKGLSDSQIMTLQEEAMLRVTRNIAQTSVLGYKQDGTSAVPYMTAGLLQQLTDNASGNRPVLTDAIGGALTEDALRGSLRTVFQKGSPSAIYCSYDNKDIINGFIHSATSTTISQNTDLVNSTAGYYVDGYNFEGAMLDVKVDSSVPNDQIAIVNNSKCRKGWLSGDALTLNDEPAVSSREFRQSITGSFGVAIEDVGYEHILMTGLTT